MHNLPKFESGKPRRRGKKRPEKSDSPKAPQIFTLPPEIISYIFVLGTFHMDGNDSDDDDNSSPFPRLALWCSHVCRYFRQIALSTPQLWTYIDFREGSPYTTADTFLSRSKDASLRLDIDLTTGSGTQDDDDIIGDMKKESATIYSMIGNHVHRWKEFELKADYYEIISYWLLQLSKHDSAPRLESFGILCHEEWRDPEQFHPRELRDALSIFTGGTPRIKSVELWGVHFDWNNITFLCGLTTLRLAWHTRDVGLTATQFMETLEKCPNLHELGLQQSGPVKGTWPKERVTLKYLEELQFSFLDLNNAIDILEHIQFSELKKLVLDLEQDTVEPFIKSFLTHRHKFSNVLSLKLRSFNCSHSSANTFLQAFPNVTSLDLNFNYLVDSFRVALAEPRPPFCPKLDTLTLSGLDFSKLRQVIECRPRFSITTLHLDKTEGWDNSEINRFKKFVKNVRFYTCSDDEEATSEEGYSDEWHLPGNFHSHSEMHHDGGPVHPAAYYDPHYVMYGDNGHMYDDSD